MTRSSDAHGPDSAAVASSKGVFKTQDKIVARATVIGVRDPQGLLRTPKTPFCPGDRVYPADNELMVATLGLTQGGAYLGVLEGTDLPVMVDRNKLVQKHISILAMTGSGKSYTAAVIMEEMMEKDVPLLIIDPHGEYSTLKYPNDDQDIDELCNRFDVDVRGYEDVTIYTPANLKTCEYADKVLRLNGRNLKPGEIIQYAPGDLNNSEIGLVYEAVNQLEDDRRNFAIKEYGIRDVLDEIKASRSNQKWAVINKLEPLVSAEFLSDRPTPVQELFTKGRASIIDMKGVNPDVQQTIIARLLSMLFEARKTNAVPPGLVVVEEAHLFCPEKGFLKTTSGEVLRTIASEGRKFGLGLMIVSQRPAKVDKNVLSQCSTQIIMRVTNPNDLKAITKSLEGISSELEEEIKRLPPGVALFVSPDIPRPIMVQVRVRRSRHGGTSTAISDEFAEEIEEPAVEEMSGAEAEAEAEAKPETEIVRKPPRQEPKKEPAGGLFHRIFGRR
ncbi:MAG: AAA-like domain protein [Methanocella sp. PtaU1.Bin125]|nr:MAG: AAA-like domain protein [Methanocella sp. PtaU1.Bin125]